MFKNLAKIISERKFFEVEEMELLIKTYFELYQQEQLSEALENDDIIKRRNVLLAKQKDLFLERSSIEKQLFIAKNKIKEKEYVDMDWMAKANLAFRIKKAQIVEVQNSLTNLKSYERKRNSVKSIDAKEGIFEKKYRNLLVRIEIVQKERLFWRKEFKNLVGEEAIKPFYEKENKIRGEI